MSPGDARKKAAGAAGAALVENGMVVGLGSGSTAVFFVEALAARHLSIRCVATSRATSELAASRGLTLTDLDAVEGLDLTVDGADEIGPGLGLIKGGGGALLREKLVWLASRRCVVIADATKLSGTLGRFPLPIEIVDFGAEKTAARVEAVLRDLDIEATPKLRLRDGAAVRTDGGNLIYDAACREIDDPPSLAARLKQIAGVVEHGLFIGLAERALIGADDRVDTLYP